jgi:hypothetical protein
MRGFTMLTDLAALPASRAAAQAAFTDADTALMPALLGCLADPSIDPQARAALVMLRHGINNRNEMEIAIAADVIANLAAVEQQG